MLSIILTLACSDHYMAYPVDKVQDTEEETIDTPVDTIGIHDEPMDTGEYGDTGYDEPIIETDEPVEETDEPVDTGYEEPVEETDEPVEVEEEDTDTGSTTTTTVPTDNYNYSDDFTASKTHHWGGNTHYAIDYGYTMIDSDGDNVALVCGLMPNGLVDCFCEEHNSSYPQCNNVSGVISHIPFQSFVDVSVAMGQICTIDSNGSALCWDQNGSVFNLPQMNPYVDIVSLTGSKVCALDDQGSLYCFDTTTGGVIHSDAHTYKAIEGKRYLVCGVLDNAENIECTNLAPYTNMPQATISRAVNNEIIGMDAGAEDFCWAYLDGNGMQNVECYRLHSAPAQCIYSAPHEYYYDFFTNNTDLSNLEVYGGWGAFYDSAQDLEVRWGGSGINNGYYTGSGCNYYWGN